MTCIKFFVFVRPFSFELSGFLRVDILLLCQYNLINLRRKATPERERERELGCVCVCEIERKRELACVCV